MIRREYTEDEKASALAALAANAGNVDRTAAATGIPASTIRKWRDGKSITQTIIAKCGEKKAALSDAFENAAYDLLNGLTKDKIKAANATALLTAAGIAVDKMRLLREQATSISGQALSDEQRTDRLMELAERIRQRRNGAAHAGRASTVLGSDGASAMGPPAPEHPPAEGV